MNFEKMKKKIEVPLDSIENIKDIDKDFSKNIIKISERFAEKYSIFLENYNGKFDSKLLKKEGFLGNGGAGTVFEINKDVCMKVMDNRPLADNYNDYDTEAKIALDMNGFKSSDIRMPVFFSYYRTEHNREILMEKIDGVNLQEVFNRSSAIPEEFLNKYFHEKKIDISLIEDKLNDFFESMHDKGIYHGDIAPRNIMIDTQGDIIVIDTGRSGYLLGEEKDMYIQKDYDGIDDIISEFEQYLSNNNNTGHLENKPVIHFDNKENGVLENQIFDERIISLAKKYIENHDDVIYCDEFVSGLFISKNKDDFILGIKAIIVESDVYYIGFKKD